MNQPETIAVHVLDGGRIDILDWAIFDPKVGPGIRRTLANPCYLISHPTGTLLWDTGLGDTIATEAGGRLIGDIAVFHVETPLTAQLDQIGIGPDDITYLALSHLHVDHVGNVDLFRTNTVLIQGDEFDAAFGQDAHADTSPFETLRQNPLHRLDGDHDVFGDGTVVIKRFPGHTPGSQSLLLRLSSGAVLVSGDLAHSTDNWANRVVPTLNVDAVQTRASMQAAAQLITDENATLWIQHEASQFQSMRRWPEYYK